MLRSERPDATGYDRVCSVVAWTRDGRFVGSFRTRGPENEHVPSKMVVGRLLSEMTWPVFRGDMLIFGG